MGRGIDFHTVRMGSSTNHWSARLCRDRLGLRKGAGVDLSISRGRGRLRTGRGHLTVRGPARGAGSGKQSARIPVGADEPGCEVRRRGRVGQGVGNGPDRFNAALRQRYAPHSHRPRPNWTRRRGECTRAPMSHAASGFPAACHRPLPGGISRKRSTILTTVPTAFEMTHIKSQTPEGSAPVLAAVAIAASPLSSGSRVPVRVCGAVRVAGVVQPDLAPTHVLTSCVCTQAASATLFRHRQGLDTHPGPGDCGLPGRRRHGDGMLIRRRGAWTVAASMLAAPRPRAVHAGLDAPPTSMGTGDRLPTVRPLLQ